MNNVSAIITTATAKVAVLWGNGTVRAHNFHDGKAFLTYVNKLTKGLVACIGAHEEDGTRRLLTDDIEERAGGMEVDMPGFLPY